MTRPFRFTQFDFDTGYGANRSPSEAADMANKKLEAYENEAIKIAEKIIKNAAFVLAGSVAAEGQSDEILDKRQRALVEFLLSEDEWLEKYGSKK